MMIGSVFDGAAKNAETPPILSGYLDLPGGANIWRLGDRVRVDAAVLTEDNYTPVSGGTWLRTAVNQALRWIEKGASLAAFSSRGEVGGAFASRRSDNTQTAADPPTVGVVSFVYNDAAGDGSAWGGYLEGRRITGAGRVFGAEIDVANEGTEAVDVHAHDVSNKRTAIGLWLASGGDAANTNASLVFDAHVALGVVNNGARWRKGIVFGFNALTDHGVNDFRAMELAPHQSIDWKYSPGAKAFSGRLKATGASAPTHQRIEFGLSSLMVRGVESDLQTETTLFSVNAPALAAGQSVNSLAVQPRAAANGADGRGSLVAMGTGANVDLELCPKGSGFVRFGARQPITGAMAVTGYIEIKDASGVIRKLAVIE